MERFDREIEGILKDKEGGKRETRQASILKINRERTRYVYILWKSKRINNKQLGEYIRKGKADTSLISYWKKEKNLCCILCIRKGKRCVCRKIKGVECTNCRCKGECVDAIKLDE